MRLELCEVWRLLRLRRFLQRALKRAIAHTQKPDIGRVVVPAPSSHQRSPRAPLGQAWPPPSGTPAAPSADSMKSGEIRGRVENTSG